MPRAGARRRKLRSSKILSQCKKGPTMITRIPAWRERPRRHGTGLGVSLLSRGLRRDRDVKLLNEALTGIDPPDLRPLSIDIRLDLRHQCAIARVARHRRPHRVPLAQVVVPPPGVYCLLQTAERRLHIAAQQLSLGAPMLVEAVSETALNPQATAFPRLGGQQSVGLRVGAGLQV